MSSEEDLRVLGTARRSLFDTVKPADVRAAGERIRGPGGMALAALRHQGVTGGQLTPVDAVVLGGRAFGAPRDGWLAVGEDEAIAVAFGVAATRSTRTAGGRTWALLRTAALRHGPALEALVLLRDLPAVRLCPVIVGPSDDAEGALALCEAVGLPARSADNDDAWSVLSAFDHVARAAERGAAVVVATREPR